MCLTAWTAAEKTEPRENRPSGSVVLSGSLLA
jgi:hypothetical protein